MATTTATFDDRTPARTVPGWVRGAAAMTAILLAACSSRGVVIESGPPGPGPSSAATLGIPPGHLPPAGQCRVWIPGEPPGHQRAPGSCAVQASRVPPHGWLVYNPGRSARGESNRGRGRGRGAGKAHIRVTVYGDASPRMIRYYEKGSGEFVREEDPGER